jgi:hypothetical protein
MGGDQRGPAVFPGPVHDDDPVGAGREGAGLTGQGGAAGVVGSRAHQHVPAGGSRGLVVRPAAAGRLDEQPAAVALRRPRRRGAVRAHAQPDRAPSRAPGDDGAPSAQQRAHHDVAVGDVGLEVADAGTRGMLPQRVEQRPGQPGTPRCSDRQRELAVAGQEEGVPGLPDDRPRPARAGGQLGDQPGTAALGLGHERVEEVERRVVGVEEPVAPIVEVQRVVQLAHHRTVGRRDGTDDDRWPLWMDGHGGSLMRRGSIAMSLNHPATPRQGRRSRPGRHGRRTPGGTDPPVCWWPVLLVRAVQPRGVGHRPRLVS